MVPSSRAMLPKSPLSSPASRVSSAVWKTGHTPRQSPLQLDPPLASREKKYRLRPWPSARTFPKLAVLTKRTAFSSSGGGVPYPSSSMGPFSSPDEHPRRSKKVKNKLIFFSIFSSFKFVVHVQIKHLPPSPANKALRRRTRRPETELWPLNIRGPKKSAAG